MTNGKSHDHKKSKASEQKAKGTKPKSDASSAKK